MKIKKYVFSETTKDGKIKYYIQDNINTATSYYTDKEKMQKVLNGKIERYTKIMKNLNKQKFVSYKRKLIITKEGNVVILTCQRTRKVGNNETTKKNIEKKKRKRSVANTEK